MMLSWRHYAYTIFFVEVDNSLDWLDFDFLYAILVQRIIKLYGKSVLPVTK